MIRLFRAATTIAVAAAATVLAACGGGGSSAPAQPRVPTAIGTSAPPAASRTSFGTANLTLALPRVLKTSSGKLVQARAGTGRGTQYVNPTAGNLLDIYVDGSLIPNIDGMTNPAHSLTIVTTSTGSQSTAVPLFASAQNEIVALEWDSTGTQMLALGEANQAISLAGATTNGALTMNMNVTGLGIVDFPNENSPSPLNGGSWTGLACPNAPTSSEFGIYTADLSGDFVPAAGYGGTTTPSVTWAPDSGTTSINVQPQVPGILQVVWDGSCDGIMVTATASNPVNAILQDINNNYDTYYDDWQFGETPTGNAGIWFLYFISQNSIVAALQSTQPSVTNSVNILPFLP